MKKNIDLIKFYDSVYRKGEKKHYTKLLFKQSKQTLPIDEFEVLHSTNWKAKTVLDVGCGTGLMASEIAKAGASQVTGIDFSPDAIATANQEHSHPNLIYKVEDIKKHKGSYDIIISLGTLEHMDRPFEILKILKKHLNPGGIVIITSPNWSNPRGYILQTLRFLFNAPITLADLHYLTPIEFENWAERLGMKLNWKTFDFDWAQGEKLIKDFKRRLPNVLRDMGITDKNKEIKDFIDWIKNHILTLRHDDAWSGATGLYIFKK
jgi:ubiquinone biosynthesis O-methyltransferase